MHANLPRFGEGFKMVMATDDAKGTLLSGHCHNLPCFVLQEANIVVPIISYQ